MYMAYLTGRGCACGVPEQAPIGNTEVLLGINSNGGAGNDEAWGVQVVSLSPAAVPDWSALLTQ